MVHRRPISTDVKRCPAEKEPVEVEEKRLANLIAGFFITMFAIDSMLVQYEQQESILFCIDFLIGSQCCVVDLDLLKGHAVHLHLIVQYLALMVLLAKLFLALIECLTAKRREMEWKEEWMDRRAIYVVVTGGRFRGYETYEELRLYLKWCQIRCHGGRSQSAHTHHWGTPGNRDSM